MRDITFFNKIYLAVKPVDFRMQAHGLSTLVKQVLQAPLFDCKALFIFTNKRKNAVRILYWDKTGFAMWSKLLEKDRFKWPKHPDNAALNLSAADLKLLLDGVDLSKIKKHTAVNFSETF